jgi:hypothetical protein
MDLFSITITFDEIQYYGYDIYFELFLEYYKKYSWRSDV